MTANPQWIEIQCEIPQGDDAVNHPTIVARVFRLKLKELLYQLLKMNRLGRVASYIYTIEFQKRGYPHVHLILTLDPLDRPVTPDDVDLLVSAKIPEKNLEPDLHRVVTTSMLHGPCAGCACSSNGKCRYRYPKTFQDETIFVEGAYPSYRRRDDGQKIVKGQITFDNRDVVPHNKYLSIYMNCHINVEVAVGIELVKYLYKYITKGHDRSYMEMKNNDETAAYIDARYVGAPEAAWRIFQFELSDRFPAVQRLAIHDAKSKRVSYNNGNGEVLQGARILPEKTTLTDYFRLVNEGAMGLWKSAMDCTYPEIVNNFWWDDVRSGWRLRERPMKTVGRMHFVSIHQGERYYIRLLLSNRKGVRSFLDLRTVSGVLYESFRSAADALGLLVNDNQHDLAMSEAAVYKTGHELRLMFAIILVHCPPSAPGEIYTKHYRNLSDDVRYLLLNKHGIEDPELAIVQGYTSHLISTILRDMGKTLDSVGLTDAQADLEIIQHLLRPTLPELPFGATQESVEDRLNKFNKDQKDIFDRIMSTLNGHSRLNTFFLDRPGGTGKTYLLNTLIDTSVIRGLDPVVVASTGVVALLLSGGQTAHSAFQLPLALNDTSQCAITPFSPRAQKLRAASIIIWDEIVTMHLHGIHAVDRFFKTLMGNNKDFGGKTVIFSGDFRQTLPVVGFQMYPSSRNATLKSSHLWDKMTKLSLTINMRLRMSSAKGEDKDCIAFDQELLSLGCGDLQSQEYDKVKLSAILVEQRSSVPDLIQAAIDEVYKSINLHLKTGHEAYLEYLSSRAIISPLNSETTLINKELTQQLSGTVHEFKSVDWPDDQALDSLPAESLNRLNFPGFPRHSLKLKIGMPVMLLRNLNICKGLSNGTRMIVTKMSPRAVVAKIMTGKFKNKEVVLCRIILHYDGDPQAKISFYRHQFPLVPCFGMTINKSQEQTLNHVAVLLKSPVFSHGQLYVALSRVTSPNNLKVFQLGTSKSVVNVVYKELVD